MTTVELWKELVKAKACKPHQIIRLTNGSRRRNPKRGRAEGRFALYRDGMTVGEYVQISSDAGNPKALALADVCWDVASGFIVVTDPPDAAWQPGAKVFDFVSQRVVTGKREYECTTCSKPIPVGEQHWAITYIEWGDDDSRTPRNIRTHRECEPDPWS